jgi:hypothetical protein
MAQNPTDPFKGSYKDTWFPTLRVVLERFGKNPVIGVTQGGSSRLDAGCRPAATRGTVRAYKTTGES